MDQITLFFFSQESKLSVYIADSSDENVSAQIPSSHFFKFLRQIYIQMNLYLTHIPSLRTKIFFIKDNYLQINFDDLSSDFDIIFTFSPHLTTIDLKTIDGYRTLCIEIATIF